jgi:DNA-binding NarL/FixJ family response regulator
MAGKSVPQVLLIDRNPVVRMVIRRTLEEEGFQVRESPGGASVALGAFADPPAVLISEVDLGDPVDVETLRLVRLGFPRVPIIACCRPHTRLDATTHLERLGVVAAFVKPVPLFELVDAVRAAASARPVLRPLEGAATQAAWSSRQLT